MRLPLDPRIPVLVGQAQVLQHEEVIGAARGPIELMSDAVRGAFADAGCVTPTTVDAIHVLRTLSTKVHNPAAAVSRATGIEAHIHGYTSHGGNLPQALVNLASLEIQAGRADCIVLTGGECSRTRRRARAAGVTPAWSTDDTISALDPQPAPIGGNLEMLHPLEIERNIVLPIEIYPMFETALRHESGMTVAQHRAHVGELWSRFSAVSADNPNAWIRDRFSAEQITTAAPENRMVGYPYTKLMNSNNDVDMAAALIVCSASWADSMGIARDRWVFPIAGTDAHEHNFVSHRWSFTDTPAIRLGAKRLLELTKWSVEDIDVIDLYSCFPSAVQLGARSIGLSLNDRLTCTGGLSFAGGPFNNYVMHAIATTIVKLREKPQSKGFVWANGGYATKHSFGAYQSSPPTHPFLHDSPQREIDSLPKRHAASATDVAGDVVMESYSVMHDRNGSPSRLAASVLTSDGTRAWGISTDVAMMRHAIDNDAVGEIVRLHPTGEIASCS